MALEMNVYGTTTGRFSSSDFSRSNTPKAASPAQRFRVELGYGELGSGESHHLAEWVGEADSQTHAKALAHAEHWDPRLDAGGCTPRYKVTRVK